VSMEEQSVAPSAAVVTTVADLVRDGVAELAAAGVPSAKLDAEVLLAAALGVDRTSILTRSEARVPVSAMRAFASMLERRRAREPLAYIIGKKEFWSLELEVSAAVLIPRPETELVVETAVDVLRDWRSSTPVVCDVGTGSGCIAVALACELARVSIVALDTSPAAIEIARRNAVKHQVVDRVELLVSDLFAAIGGRRFDVVVANPPYVAHEDLAKLAPELRWEPDSALDGGNGGLQVIRRLLAETAATLVSEGWLVMEIGADQGTVVEALAREGGFGQTWVRSDYAGMPRVLVAQVI